MTEEKTIRSSAAEYLAYIATTGDNPQSFEIRYEDMKSFLKKSVKYVFLSVGFIKKLQIFTQLLLIIPWPLMGDIRTEHITCLPRESWAKTI